MLREQRTTFAGLIPYLDKISRKETLKEIMPKVGFVSDDIAKIESEDNFEKSKELYKEFLKKTGYYREIR